MQNDLENISRRIGKRLRLAYKYAREVQDAQRPNSRSCSCGGCQARIYYGAHHGKISVQAWQRVAGEPRFFGERLARNPEEAVKFAAEWTGNCICMRQ